VNGIFCWKNRFGKSGYYLEQIRFQFGKIRKNSILNSSPMTSEDKVGLAITIIAFGIIFSPLALSESDPYHVKGLLEETKKTFNVFSDFINPQVEYEIIDGKQYRFIAHFQVSVEKDPIDTIEKVFLGKLKAKTY